VLPLGLVEKIVEIMLISEKEPILSLGASCGALLDERAEGSDPGSWTDHDDRRIRILGKLEVLVVMKVDASGRVFVPKIGDEGRADAFFHSSVRLVANGCDREMNFVRVS